MCDTTNYARMKYLRYYNNFLMFLGTPVKGLRHYAYAKAYGIEVPWVGMDNSGCPYLEENCKGNGQKNLSFQYPMKVEEFYPPVG